MSENRDLIPVLWFNGESDHLEPEPADLEVERDDVPDSVSVHTFTSEGGSQSSYVLSGERARRLALRLLAAAEPR